MCLICGENEGYFDDGSPCWGCNFTYCPTCGAPVIRGVPCFSCKPDQAKVKPFRRKTPETPLSDFTL